MGKFCNIKIVEIPDEHVYRVISAFFGEFFGTLLFICIGCMGLVNSDEYYFLAGMNFGLILMIVLEAFTYVSGGVLNPALAWCALICQKINCGTCFCYLIAQFSGSICGYALLCALVPSNYLKQPSCSGICVTVPQERISSLVAFGIEFVITWILAWAYCTQWCSPNSARNDSISLKLGLIFGVLYCVSARYTGGSMNPARSLAAAIFNDCWKNHWVYWAGPLAGSIIASIIYKISYNLKCTLEYLSKQNVPKL